MYSGHLHRLSIPFAYLLTQMNQACCVQTRARDLSRS